MPEADTQEAETDTDTESVELLSTSEEEEAPALFHVSELRCKQE